MYILGHSRYKDVFLRASLEVLSYQTDTTVSQTQFRTQTLYSTIQTMWKKQTNETLSPAMAGISTSQSFSPLPMSPLPSSYALSPTISEVQSSNNSGYHTGRQNTLSFAHGGPQTQPPSTSGFVNRMDWVQQAQQLTATLKSSANLNSMVPYAWVCPYVLCLF